MGRAGAYLEVGRRTHGERPWDETVRDFDEFARPLSEELQELQASRCMYCGVAFCQTGVGFGTARTSGCPLHNLIPEWNDLAYRGLWEEAAERMALTNPFPEFTGRVCPALCEAACNLGLHDEPTTIKDDERAISDHAWGTGSATTRPLPAPAADAPAVAVIGSGPAGLAAAWELCRRGARVTVLERADRAGGLLMYGIPNMKLPKDVVERRIDLMRRSGVSFELGVDVCDPVQARRLADGEFAAVVVAAGARSARMLTCPGADAAGVVLAVDYLTASTRSVLAGTGASVSARGKDVVVVGGGDTGTDCVATALRQGASHVTQLEFLPAPPDERAEGNAWPEWPDLKKTDYGQLEAIEAQGADPRQWATDTLEVLTDGAGAVRALHVVSLDWSHGGPEPIEGTERDLPAQLVLIAMGFSGPEADVYEALGCETSELRGGVRPVVDGGAHRVSGTGDVAVYAAGDARSGSSLVVSAIADGLSCAADVAEALAL